MSSHRRPRGTNKTAKQAAEQEFVDKHSSMRLLGEVITWGMDNQVHSHSAVVQALKDAGLSTEPAKEILPRHAFTRASKKLTEDKVIDELAKDGDLLSFQFTKRELANKEWKYSKDTVLILNTATGKVECKDKKLESFAQRVLDKAIVDRTTADVTKIIQKLFDAEADLFPLRDQGGVYFVPEKFNQFVDKIKMFVQKLGGRVNRFPVPADTKDGNQSVQDAVVNGLTLIVDEHEQAIEEFDVNTRSDTLERMAKKIRDSRTKVEAYANYLQDRAQEMLDAVDLANNKLLQKIGALEKERADAPASANGGVRTMIHGHSVTAVIRWMASVGWKFAESKKVLESFKDVQVSDATIRAQLGGWKERGEPAKLTADQIKDLNKRKDSKVAA